MREEKQEAIKKQEANSQELKVYFRAMNLSLHKHEEDFNASMSILSIYHQELHEHFSYYAQPFDSGYKSPINDLIPLQGLLNFSKVLKLAESAGQMAKYFKETLCQIEGVNTPLDDTLNIKNGLNYAQFLEAILRICMSKSEEQKVPFKKILEELFKGTDDRRDKLKPFDLKYRTESDPVLHALLEYMFLKGKQEANEAKSNMDFFEYERLFSTVFWKHTNPQTN